MKTLRSIEKTSFPILAALLFGLHVMWMYLFHLSMLVYAFILIPIYLFAAIMLLRRHRDGLLAMAVILLLFARRWSINMIADMDGMSPAWMGVSVAYLIGTVLLLAAVLVNNIHVLRRFRAVVNRLWFLPGGVMLLAAAGCCVYTQSYLEPGFLSLRGWILSTFNVFCCPVTDAVATLLISRWLSVAAEDDLQPYLAMRGSIITEEEFQAKKRELGLQGLRI